MATHTGQQNQQQPQQSEMTNISNNNKQAHQAGDIHPVPVQQFRNARSGEFRFWLFYGKQHQLQLEPYQFNQLSIQQQASNIFQQQFATTSDTITFMYNCIKKKMIWQPNCQIINGKKQFTTNFITYCTNWLKIMYYMKWYIQYMMVTNQLLCELEAATLNKLNQLHTNQELTDQSKKLSWDDDSLIVSIFPIITDAQGHEMDITFKSFQNAYNKYTLEEKESDSNVTANNDNNDKKENIHGVRHNDKQRLQEMVQDIKKELEKIEQSYHKVDLEIEKIDNYTDSQKMQHKLDQQVKMVQQHMEKVKEYQKALPITEVLKYERKQVESLMKNNEIIKDEILQMRIAQAQSFLLKHQQLNPTLAQVQNSQSNENNIRTTLANTTLPEVPVLSNNTMNTTISTVVEKKIQKITTTRALADPQSYTRHSKNLFDNRQGHWKEKEEYKDERNENEKINLKFTGKEENIKKAATTFIKNIQIEAETLIARGVFSESIFVNHVIYKCIKDEAYDDFTDSKSSKILPLNPTKVSEIVYYMINKYQLVDYIEEVKNAFEKFEPKNIHGYKLYQNLKNH